MVMAEDEIATINIRPPDTVQIAAYSSGCTLKHTIRILGLVDVCQNSVLRQQSAADQRIQATKILVAFGVLRGPSWIKGCSSRHFACLRGSIGFAFHNTQARIIPDKPVDFAFLLYPERPTQNVNGV